MTAFKLPDMVRTAPYNGPRKGGLFIDALTAQQGYVTVGYVGDKHGYDRLKFQVRKGEQVYNYDFFPSGKPTRYPVNMGSGFYAFRIMERIEGNSYVERMAIAKEVNVASPFVPYTIPTVFCDYDTDGPCVRMARLILEDCKTDVEALGIIVKWVAGYLSYDYDRAKELSGATGYVPNPDKTLRERSGICFDYASVCAAMLRSVGIPCKVVTGYVDGDSYHAWVVAHVDGKWRRCDPTYLSVLKEGFRMSDYTYTNRFVY